MNNYFFSVSVIGGAGPEGYVTFAPNERHAKAMLTYFSKERLQPALWSRDDWQMFETYGTKAQLQLARDLNKTGLGLYTKAEGWKIVSLGEIINSRRTGSDLYAHV